MNKEELSGTEVLTKILTEMNAKSGFPISVLTDKDGLPIAWASTSGDNPERQSAVVAYVQRTALQVSKQLEMTEVEEVSYACANGQHFICRPFQIDDNGFILAVTFNARDKSYRRATNVAITEIKNMWKQYWKSSLWA